MGINPINNISIIIKILFAVTLFQQKGRSRKERKDIDGSSQGKNQ
jgi:hypothetical protein